MEVVGERGSILVWEEENQSWCLRGAGDGDRALRGGRGQGGGRKVSHVFLLCARRGGGERDRISVLRKGKTSVVPG